MVLISYIKTASHPLPYESPHLLTLSWQKLIYEELGYPPGVDSEDFDKVQIPRKYRKKEG